MFHCVTVVADIIMDKNPVNLTGNVIITQLLINIVCTNVEVTIVNNDIRVVKISIIQTHPRANRLRNRDKTWGLYDFEYAKAHVQRGLLPPLLNGD